MRLASASWDGTVRDWDLSLIHGQARAIVVGPNGQRVAMVTRAGELRVVEVATGRLIAAFPISSGGTANVLAVSLDGAKVALGTTDGIVSVWNLASGRPSLIRTDGLGCQVSGLDFDTPAVRLVAACQHVAAIIDLVTGRTPLTFSPPEDLGDFNSAVFSADGTRLATANDHGAALWDADSHSIIRRFGGHTDRVVSVALSRDGARLASGSADRTARVWDTATGSAFPVERHDNVVTTLALSEDGSRLATAAADNRVTVWDVATGGGAAVIEGVRVDTLAFGSDTTSLVAADSTLGAYVLPLRLDDLTSLAEGRIVRAFDDDECLRYLHASPCPPPTGGVSGGRR
jgi:WD40 repeat protein